ncbi:MAG TPA: LysR family transcriptional regulator [Polyangiales bacterium]|nr:LysR family transcriptional regulator [Polyangiales bacterium]
MARTRSPRPLLDAPLDDLAALQLFAQVVDTGSFTATARKNGTTTSAVSKRIAGLERRFGVRLIERSTRHALATEAGLVLYEHCQRLLVEARAAEEAVAAHRGALHGTLRVSAPVTFGHMHVAPLVRTFLEPHPSLRVLLSLNDRKVDLISEGIDLAVRSGQVEDSALISRSLAPDRRVICAAPSYFARHGTPRQPNDLSNHECLKHTLMAPAHGWALQTRDGPITIPVSGRLEIDNIAALREAALAGFGLILVPAYAVAAELRAGTLVAVLETFLPESAPFRALWVAGKHRPARLLALVEHLARELPKRLESPVT